MRRSKRMLAIVLTIALIISMQAMLMTVKAIETGDWFGSDQTTQLVETEGVVSSGGWGYFYNDQEYQLGDTVEFDLKMALKSGETKPGGWFMTVNLLDNAIGQVFWQNTAKQLAYQFTPEGSGTRSDLLIMDNTQIGAVWNKQTETDLFDSEWHTLSFNTSTGEDNQIVARFSVDGSEVVNETLSVDSKDLQSIFASGILSIYLNDSTKNIYDVSVKNLSISAPPEPSPVPFDFEQALEDESFRMLDGTPLEVDGDVAKFYNTANGDTQFFYLNQTIQMNETISFMGKFAKDPNLDLTGSWQMVINMFDHRPGTHFWDANARNINIQITPDSFGGIGYSNVVYAYDTSGSYNVAMYDSETEVNITDGEWHLISYKVFTLENGDIRVIMLIDDKPFVDSVFEKGDSGLDFAEKFNGAFLSFYFMDTYDIELKAAPADTPEIVLEEDPAVTPVQSEPDDDEPATGDMGITLAGILIALSALTILSMKKKVRV